MSIRGIIPPTCPTSCSAATIRQLYNYQQGTRQSALMKPIAAKLAADDMSAIAAYLGSL